MRRIIGIDPGLTRTGWGLIISDGSRLQFVACGTIAASDSTMPLAARLLRLHEGLEKVLSEHSPTEAAMEETFATANGASTLKLGQARGALMLTLAQAGLSVAEYATRTVKKSLVGTGRAEKHQVAEMVSLLLPPARQALMGEKHDASDALAIAICHAHHR
ncbi:MAG: crossover junction endodeoxyribonuclease RuvC [Pseudomonadota bacterium]